MYERMLELIDIFPGRNTPYTCYSYWFHKRQQLENYVLWWYIFVFLVCSISTKRYTGTIIEQDTQQAVACDTYFDSNKNPLITVLCVLAQLMIFVHTQHACKILLQWKWSCFLSLYSIVPVQTQLSKSKPLNKTQLANGKHLGLVLLACC